jgi:hypothetical protein
MGRQRSDPHRLADRNITGNPPTGLSKNERVEAEDFAAPHSRDGMMGFAALCPLL